MMKLYVNKKAREVIAGGLVLSTLVGCSIKSNKKDYLDDTKFDVYCECDGEYLDGVELVMTTLDHRTICKYWVSGSKETSFEDIKDGSYIIQVVEPKAGYQVEGDAQYKVNIVNGVCRTGDLGISFVREDKNLSNRISKKMVLSKRKKNGVSFY